VLWGFANFIALCALVPDKQENVSYPFGDLFIFILCSMVFFTVGGYINYSTKRKITIDTKVIRITSMFNKLVSEHLLADMVDFKWSNQPYDAGTRYGTVRLKKEYFIISFKNAMDIKISGNEFDNFDLIRNYLYNYCVNNQIIKVKSPR
jgi:hypothetical protein